MPQPEQTPYQRALEPPWPKCRPAQAAGLVVLFGLVLAGASVGSSAYIQEGLPSTWLRTTALCILIPACTVGIARLGLNGLRLLLLSIWIPLTPGLVGLVLILTSATDIEVAFLWLDTSLYLIYAFAAGATLLAAKGWRKYFKDASYRAAGHPDVR
jgi:hypothetical protein